jgi:hypothetical protein
MKGKAHSIPTNHVQWVNGFKSNMPDWPSARKCAIADKMHYTLSRVRSMMFALERAEKEQDCNVVISMMLADPSWKSVFDSVYECVDICEGMMQDRIDEHVLEIRGAPDFVNLKTGEEIHVKTMPAPTVENHQLDAYRIPSEKLTGAPTTAVEMRERMPSGYDPDYDARVDKIMKKFPKPPGVK